MEIKSRLILVAFSLIGFCGIAAIPVLIMFSLGTLSVTFYWGIVIGLVLGTGTWLWLFLSQTWDPVHMSFKDYKRGKDRKWILPVILIALVIGRTILEMLSRELSLLITGSILFWLIWVGLLMWLQAWWHYLRR